MTDTQVTQTILEVAEVATTVNTNVSQVILEVAYTPAAEVSSGSGTAVGGGGSTRGQFLPRGEKVEWTIDNEPVKIDWRELKARANGGYEQADLVIPTGDGRWRGTVDRGAPKNMGQGSIVRAYRENGDILYEAELAAEPQSFEGQVLFWVVGAVERLRRQQTRIPWQLAGGAGWTDRTSDPFTYTNNEKFSLESKDKSLSWQISKSETYDNGQKAGFALLVAGHPLKRIAFTLHKSSASGNFDLELYRANDVGTLTLEKSWNLGTAHPDGDEIDYTLDNPGNTLSLVVTCNTNGTNPGSSNRIWLTHLRVNGIDNDDRATTSDVITRLADRLDYRTADITGGGVGVLPLDHEGQWSELADDMAEINDWYWFVGADQSKQQFGAMVFGDWGGADDERTWRGAQGEGLDCNLVLLPRYNRVMVLYESPAGVRQQLVMDTTDVDDLDDPLPDGVFPFPEPIIVEDPQDDDSLPKAIARAALRKLNNVRAQGDVTVTRYLNGAPYDTLPGDQLKIGNFNPDLPVQRIMDVSYLPGGTARLSVGRSFDVTDIVRGALRRRRHRR